MPRLLAFLKALFAEGHVRVPREPLARTATGDAGFEHVLRERDSVARLGLPFEPPSLNLNAAHWAAIVLYSSCQCMTYRDMNADQVQKLLAVDCTEPKHDPSVHYSVDLIFQVLPDLISMASGISPSDPLVTRLLELARDWPLSSVGVKNVEKVDPGPLMGHPCLRRLYIDRIMLRKDRSRLTTPEVCDAIREALGMHPSLCPTVASWLEEMDAETSAKSLSKTNGAA